MNGVTLDFFTHCGLWLDKRFPDRVCEAAGLNRIAELLAEVEREFEKLPQRKPKPVECVQPDNPSCIECGAQLWLGESGFVCPNGHGRIVPGGGKARSDVVARGTIAQRGKAIADGIKRMEQLDK